MNSKKSQATAKSERSNVKFIMWRKKVDNSLLRYGTDIPRWTAKLWEIDKYFPDKNGFLRKTDPESHVLINFLKQDFDNNHLTSSLPKKRANKVHRLFFSDELIENLRNSFVMSHMRNIESALQGDVGNIEKEIPFWEFLDIEFDYISKKFIFTDHYKQEPTFPLLFNNLSGSPSMKIIEDQILNKKKFRIHKQDWKTRENLNLEIGAFNVVYTLLDENNKSIYVGEAKDLKKRLLQNYKSIPKWTHYRYDALPKDVSDDVRVAIERMVIRGLASLLKNKSQITTKDISNYKLTNDKIDK